MRGIRLLTKGILTGLLVCGWAGFVLASPNPNAGSGGGPGGMPPNQGVQESRPFLLVPGILEGVDLAGSQKVQVKEIMQDALPTPGDKSKDLMRKFSKEAREKESPDPALAEAVRKDLADKIRKEEAGLVKLYKVLNPEQRGLVGKKFEKASEGPGMPKDGQMPSSDGKDNRKPNVTAKPGTTSMPPNGMEKPEGKARRIELRKLQKEIWELAFSEAGNNSSLSSLADRASGILVNEILEREKMGLGMPPAPNQVQ